MKSQTIYGIVSLITLLLISTINGQTVQAQDTQTVKKEPPNIKPTIMILGTYHMDNPGADAANFEADDVLAPKRQRELQQLIEQLAQFNPTKIAVEADTSLDAEVNAEYQDYLNGVYQPGRSEGDQVSFPLAQKVQHSKIYCVDWFQRGGEEKTVDVEAFAKAHNQSGLLERTYAMVQVMAQEPLTTLTEIQKTGSVIDMLRFLNQEDTIRVLHEINMFPQFTLAQIGVADQYVGLDWLLDWYERNLKIFVNLTRITESADDRILLIIGAGHVYLVQQFLENSGDYIVESPLKYLKTDENIKTVKKELPAIKTEQPPTIDGILNDACWQDAPQATGFTDERTEKPAKNQSVGRLVYTEKAIYVGLHLYDDMPDKIVARQTKDQTRITGEDWVSFSLDPFHTHQFSDRNFFIVNPLGTKYAHLATGRAEKSEWIGLWKTAAQIVEDGWIVEMEIPWQMLDYPDTTKPIRMGINLDREQQRTGERSWWCNLGVNEFRENDGHWIDVLPPRRKRELKLLPYLIGGINETETSVGATSESRWEYTARAGGDIRYEVTPQIRLIGTANPDFANIEQAVEGIDFSYGKRYVPDRRPFFLEGGNAYNVGRLFHSRQIVDMDGGLKLFGKIGKNTSVGTLGTYHRNNQNLILRASQSLTATSNLSAAFLSHHQPDASSNNIGYLSGDVRHGKLSVGSTLVQTWAGQSDGRNGFVSVGYNSSLFQPYLSAFFVDPDFVNRLGYHPFTGYRGIGLGSFIRNEWRGGLIRSASVSVDSQISNTYEGKVFRRDLSVSSLILTHSDYALAAGWRGGQFEEFNDSVFSIGLRARASDRFNNVGITYNWGKQAGETIHRISGNLNLRAYGFTAGLISQVQWRLGRLYQHIFTLTYDFTPALSLGTRLIWRSEHVNVYFALRRSGYAGMDFFIILGEPNALEFKQRLVAKVVRAF